MPAAFGVWIAPSVHSSTHAPFDRSHHSQASFRRAGRHHVRRSCNRLAAAPVTTGNRWS